MATTDHHRAVERRNAFKMIISFLKKHQSKGNHNWTLAEMQEEMESCIDGAPSMPQLRVRLTQLHEVRILNRSHSKVWAVGDQYSLSADHAAIFDKEFPEVVLPREPAKPISQWPLHALFFGRNADEPLMLA